MPILDHFGWIAPYYDRLAGQLDLQPWVERLRLPVTGLLLDAGGGTGRRSHPLRLLTGGVIVADPSLNMARQSARKDGLRPVCCEAERLPFPNGRFERIMMVDAFHHVRSQPLTAAELVRVLAPGGRLVIQEPDIRFFGIRLVALAEKLLLMRSHFYSSAGAAALFAGLPVRVSLEDSDGSYNLIVDKNEA